MKMWFDDDEVSRVRMNMLLMEVLMRATMLKRIRETHLSVFKHIFQYL